MMFESHATAPGATEEDVLTMDDVYVISCPLFAQVQVTVETHRKNLFGIAADVRDYAGPLAIQSDDKGLHVAYPEPFGLPLKQVIADGHIGGRGLMEVFLASVRYLERAHEHGHIIGLTRIEWIYVIPEKPSTPRILGAGIHEPGWTQNKDVQSHAIGLRDAFNLFPRGETHPGLSDELLAELEALVSSDEPKTATELRELLERRLADGSWGFDKRERQTTMNYLKPVTPEDLEGDEETGKLIDPSMLPEVVVAEFAGPRHVDSGYDEPKNEEKRRGFWVWAVLVALLLLFGLWAMGVFGGGDEQLAHEGSTKVDRVAAMPTHYEVQVNSNPDGAGIYLDDVKLGETPAVVTVAAGTSALELRHEGYARATVVLAGLEAQGDRLEPEPVSLESLTPVQAEPNDAELIVEEGAVENAGEEADVEAAPAAEKVEPTVRPAARQQRPRAAAPRRARQAVPAPAPEPEQVPAAVEPAAPKEAPAPPSKPIRVLGESEGDIRILE